LISKIFSPIGSEKSIGLGLSILDIGKFMAFHVELVLYGIFGLLVDMIICGIYLSSSSPVPV
jgi:hypothetical protein